MVGNIYICKEVVEYEYVEGVLVVIELVMNKVDEGWNWKECL